MAKTIQTYYQDLFDNIHSTLEKSVDEESEYYSLFAKNHSFIADFGQWIEILSKREELVIYQNAIKAFQESMLNMIMGVYQPAFMGLRYFLERCLMGAYMSASELELKTWLLGNRDTYWTELMAEENTFNDQGFFSAKFTNAYFPELKDYRTEYRKLTKSVYRDCSEYVHGNPDKLQVIGNDISYKPELCNTWNDCADTVKRCVLFAFCLRYLKQLSDEEIRKVSPSLQDEFKTIKPIFEIVYHE